MNKVWHCGISAIIAATVAFFPALSIHTNPVFADSGFLQTDPSGTASNQPVGTGDSHLALGLPTSEMTLGAGLQEADLDDVRGVTAEGPATGFAVGKEVDGTNRGQDLEPKPSKCDYRIVIVALGIENCIENHAKKDLSTPSRASGKVANISVDGARFIYGHNSAGIFANLGKIQDGAIVQVVTGAKTETYRVSLSKSRKNFDYRCLTARNVNNLSGIAAYRAANCSSLVSMSGIAYGPANTLTLMTCSGSYSRELGTNTHRHIIFAEKI
jgi:hypothetical protein